MFEVETAIAFLYFKKKKCDFVVLETGLGGSLDATNIVTRTEVAAFASISRDHMGFLGDTLTEIAENKAGIIKPGCDVVTTAQKTEVLAVLLQKAKQLDCPVTVMHPDQAKRTKESWEGQTFTYHNETFMIHMAGTYQMENALTAYEVIGALRRRGYHIPAEAVANGLEKTQWIGRFTCIRRAPLFFVDGAHNEDAAVRLKETVEHLLPNKRRIFIMGVFQDKEYDKIAQLMAPLADQIYTVNLPDEERSLPAEELAVSLTRYCSHVEAIGNIEEAVDAALKHARAEDVILAFGSLSYLGRVIAYNSKEM